jgi:carbon monoxide dehydrogenase subunit G
MPQGSATIHIDAPVARVFAFMNEPANQTAITPSLVESTEVGRMPNGGARAEYAYKMAGMTFRGHVEATELEPDRLIAFAMRGDIAGEIRWRFEPEGDGARFTYAADYEIPGSLLARLAEPIAARYNQRELDSAVANLKERLEA